MKIHINSSRVYLQKFAQKAAESVPDGGLVLDAGAGDAPYQPLFKHARYESADFCRVENAPYAQITYVTDLAELPVEDNRYDLILCSQVLEHLNEPSTVLRELYRVLKPGKELWLSAPLWTGLPD
jgi:SAM-dependent methyltransferase